MERDCDEMILWWDDEQLDAADSINGFDRDARWRRRAFDAVLAGRVDAILMEDCVDYWAQ